MDAEIAPIFGDGTEKNPFTFQKKVNDPVAKEAIAILRGGNRICTVQLLDENGVVISRCALETPITYKEGDNVEVHVSLTTKG